ncbi:MAG TPA: acyltransferase family protein [Solirubrobacterales bacterium]|nr:acyltransferase family protein [Solirubrobacterales bacterium]
MSSERLHHLDALRALTMVLILPAHAVALMGLRGGWNDAEATIYWLIHVFRLPLFFLVAGFFAALLIDARGTGAVVRNRLVRIGIPLVVVVAAVAPGLAVLLQEVATDPLSAGPDGLGAFTDLKPSYVWFLWYLAMLYATALGLRFAFGHSAGLRERLGHAGARLIPHGLAPLLLAVPCALLLYRQPTWIAEAPGGSFVPHFDLLAYYGLFFATGWALFALRGLREQIELRPRRYALFAAASLPPALALFLLQDVPAIGGSRWLHLLALLLLSVTTWSLVFALLGLSRRLLRRPAPRLRYWADASYWIYLSHFPVMAAFALVLFELALPNSLRLTILTVATLLVIYPAYGLLVRHTAVGRVLHGPRPAEKAKAPTWSVTRQAMARARRA